MLPDFVWETTNATVHHLSPQTKACGNVVWVTTSRPWAQQLTTIVGKRVKHYRQNRRTGRLSAAKLSDQTEALGHRIEASVIQNMETGRRSNVTLAELIVLASALNVTPAQLVVPLDGTDDYPLQPNRSVEPWAFYKWFTAAHLGTLPGPESPDYVLALDAYRRHDLALARYTANRRADDDGFLDSLVNVRSEIRTRGWRLPELPDDEPLPIGGRELPSIRAAVENVEQDRGAS